MRAAIERSTTPRTRLATAALLALLISVGALLQEAMPLGASGPSLAWVRQFGGPGDDQRGAVAATVGRAAIGGYVSTALPGQTHFGDRDSVVRVYAADGTEMWTRQFGTSSQDRAQGLAFDAAGNLYESGVTRGTLPGQSSAGNDDVFVRKYAPDGTVIWTRQIGTASLDDNFGASVDAFGSVYVVGSVYQGAWPGHSSAGGYDAVVVKLDALGNQVWVLQFGTPGNDAAYSVVATSSALYVGGEVGGSLAGEPHLGSSDAILRKYDLNGNLLWSRQFGTASPEAAEAVAVRSDGSIVVVGLTWGTLPGQTSATGADAFVRVYDAVGNALWTRQFGAPAHDWAGGVGVDAGDGILVAGSTDSGLPGQPFAGGTDNFVRKYNASGSEMWTVQFGNAGHDTVGFSGAAYADGALYVNSNATTAFPGQTHHGGVDIYLAKVQNDFVPTRTPAATPTDTPTPTPTGPPTPTPTRNRPTTTNQCKDSRWQTFGIFKNQGDCVSFVATRGKNPPGKP